jgi:hypothetical protein
MKESEELGKAPRSLFLVKKDKEVKFSATLPGGLYGEVTINPIEEQGDSKKVVLHLKKQAAPPPQNHAHPAGAGTGSAQTHVKPGGDLGNNPYTQKK